MSLWLCTVTLPSVCEEGDLALIVCGHLVYCVCVRYPSLICWVILVVLGIAHTPGVLGGDIWAAQQHRWGLASWALFHHLAGRGKSFISELWHVDR